MACTPCSSDLHRERRFERVDLAGLSEDDVGVLAGEWLEQPPSRELAAAVRRRTGGNPLFVEELVATSSSPARRRGLEAAATTEVPPGVHAVIGRRLARLPQGAAAIDVAGRRGRGLRAGRNRRRQRGERRRGRRSPRGGGRGRAHRRGRGPGPLPLRARAGARVRARPAVRHPPRAAAPEPRGRARRAGGPGRPSWRGTCSRRARSSTRRPPRGRRCGRRRTRRAGWPTRTPPSCSSAPGDVRATRAARRGAARARRRAPALRRRRLRRPLLRGRGRRGAGARRRRAARAGGAGAAGLTVTVGPVRHEVRTLLEEALAGVDADSPLRPRLLVAAGDRVLLRAPRDPARAPERGGARRRPAARRPRAARGARRAPRRAVEPRARVRSGCGSPTSSWRRRAPQGDREAELQGVNWRVADLSSWATREARAAIDDHERLAGELRLLGFAWYVPMWRAMLALMAGRLDEAQRFAEEGERIGHAAGDRNAALLFLVQRLAVRYAADRLTDADVAEIEEAARRSPAGAAWRMSATAIALLRGDHERGRRRVLEEAEALDSLALDANWLYSATALGIQLAHLGEADAAAARVSARAALPPPGGHVGSRERLQRIGRALAGPARGDARRRRGRRRPPRGGGAAQRRARRGRRSRRRPAVRSPRLVDDADRAAALRREAAGAMRPARPAPALV